MNPINHALINNGWKIWPDPFRRDKTGSPAVGRVKIPRQSISTAPAATKTRETATWDL